MRLLDTATLTIVNIADDAIPKYAVLSHTWGPQEVSFQDLERLALGSMSSADREKSTSLPVFAKVVEAAGLAKLNGYEYIWIDTCCIDKTSSAELSEAINSMYRWYEQAAVCYVYLADVYPSISRREPGFVEIAEEQSEIQNSRWFTRGWTLQELIAPKDVIFLAHDWSYIGRHKADTGFLKLLSKITGIDDRVLQGSLSPQDMSVSTRMKWAALRKTTRIEDIAYCLMGLFGVSMPLLYGEGKRAFIRLQEEILKETDDQSLFSWTSPEVDEQTEDFLSGLLADSPLAFKNVGHVRPLPPILTRDSVPSNITNQGLRIQLYLSPVSGEDNNSIEEYHAILDCSYREGYREYCPAIYLRRLWGDQFARIRPQKCISLRPPAEEYSKRQKGYQTIYVKQRPVYIIPEFTLPIDDILWQTISEERRYRLLDVYPPERWHSDSMSLKSVPSQLNGVMGVFRFEHPWICDLNVDIAVGLTRGGERGWESWCFQERCQGQSLEYFFKNFDLRSKGIKAFSLSDPKALGHEQMLDSSAQVLETQMHGRSYITLSVLSKPEIQTARELNFVPATISLPNNGDTGMNLDTEISTLTMACSIEDTVDSSIFPTGERTMRVRSLHKASDSSSSCVDQLKNVISSIPTGQIWAKRIQGRRQSGTDLLNACRDGDIDRVQRCIKAKMPLETLSGNFFSFRPIHWATIGGYIDIVRALVGNGAEIYSKTSQAMNIVHLAALMGHVHIIKYLLKEIKVSGRGWQGQLEAKTVETLETPFHLVAAYAPPESTQEILSIMYVIAADDGALLLPRHMNYLGETPLHRAAAMNNVTAASYILEQKTFQETLPSWGIYISCDQDQFGRSPLWHAACAGSDEIIKLLSRYNASLELADDFGRAPLHAACREGRDSAVRTLLELDANPNCETSPLGLTPCDYAALFGNSECLRWLIQYGANINIRSTDPSRFTSIDLAAANGQLECVKILFSAGAKHKSPSTHYLLLDGAATGARLVMNATQSAEEVAHLQGHLEIVEFLRDRDAYWESQETALVMPRRRTQRYLSVIDIGTLQGDPTSLTTDDEAWKAIPMSPGV